MGRGCARVLTDDATSEEVRRQGEIKGAVAPVASVQNRKTEKTVAFLGQNCDKLAQASQGWSQVNHCLYF